MTALYPEYYFNFQNLEPRWMIEKTNDHCWMNCAKSNEGKGSYENIAQWSEVLLGR